MESRNKNELYQVQLKVLFLVGVTGSLLAACGGGSGGSTETGVTVTVTPTDATTDVALDSTVTATFSEDMFATTIDASSFTLSGGSNVSGSVAFDALTNVATFTPSSTLELITTYTASLSNVITDLPGNPITAMNWSFTTRDGVWRTPELVETDDSGRAKSPQLAFDGNGNAFAVWQQSDGTRFNIWSNRYAAGTGWGTPVLLENMDSTGDYQPQLAVDANGNAMVVWWQNSGTFEHIWANYYTVGSGWGTAVQIDDNSNAYSYGPQVAFDSNGNALAVWSQATTTSSIWANRFIPGTGWGTPALIESSNENALGPNLAVDSQGNAVAIWYQDDGTYRNIWANHYTPGSGWVIPQLIENNSSGNAFNSDVAFDNNGNAIALWSQTDGTQFDIWANRYTAGSGWGEPVLVENENLGDADSAKLAFDANNNAIAVWRQSSGTRYSIKANRYTASTGWGNAVSIEVDNSGDAVDPKIAIDAKGNALAVWHMDDGQKNNVWANRYINAPGQGWGDEVRITTTNTTHATDAHIAFDHQGNALSVWIEGSGIIDNLWANRFD